MLTMIRKAPQEKKHVTFRLSWFRGKFSFPFLQNMLQWLQEARHVAEEKKFSLMDFLGMGNLLESLVATDTIKSLA